MSVERTNGERRLSETIRSYLDRKPSLPSGPLATVRDLRAHLGGIARLEGMLKPDPYPFPRLKAGQTAAFDPGFILGLVGEGPRGEGMVSHANVRGSPAWATAPPRHPRSAAAARAGAGRRLRTLSTSLRMPPRASPGTRSRRLNYLLSMMTDTNRDKVDEAIREPVVPEN